MKDRERNAMHLLAKMCFLIVVLFVLSAIIRNAIGLPYAWVTDRMWAGEEILQENSEGYNTVFVGSSKTFRGIDPNAFDSYVNRLSDEGTKTFNFGLGGATSGQIYGLSKHIIDTYNEDIKYLFVELRSVETSTRKKAFVKNLHTKRATIWMSDFASLKYALRSFWGAKNLALSFIEKIRFSVYFFVKYLDNRLNIGIVTDMIERRNANPDFEKELGQNGFVGLAPGSEPGLMKRHNKFKKEAKQIVKESRLHSKKTFGRNSIEGFEDQINQAYVSELESLINYGAEKGVKVIVVALPLLKSSDYRNVFPVFKSLPEDAKIDLCNSLSNKELYMEEHCWDESHRNVKGAELMSQRAGQRFLKVMGYKKFPVPYWQNLKNKKEKIVEKDAL